MVFHKFFLTCAPKRRGARVVEEVRLESVYTVWNRIESSNLFLSAL